MRAVIRCVAEHGEIGMDPETAGALAALRRFNYERIYTRPAAVKQARSVVDVLTSLVEHYRAAPESLPNRPDADAGSMEATLAAVTWISGMTDRYAFETAVRELGWHRDRLPKAIDYYSEPGE